VGYCLQPFPLAKFYDRNHEKFHNMNHTAANKNVHCILTREEKAEKLAPGVRGGLGKSGVKSQERTWKNVA
jgi:hypothetical protein